MPLKTRCAWVNQNPLMIRYHDEEWGKPVYEDHQIFERLVLESMQAGLSWEIVLKKRQTYRDTFFAFDPEKVAHMEDQELETCFKNPGLIRHRAKIFSIRQNARVFLALQRQHGSFARYLSSYIVQVPQKKLISQHLSKDLKKAGMCFVGPTTLYAFMQAVGIVNRPLSKLLF